jgi:hypothetical protein
MTVLTAVTIICSFAGGSAIMYGALTMSIPALVCGCLSTSTVVAIKVYEYCSPKPVPPEYQEIPGYVY